MTAVMWLPSPRVTRRATRIGNVDPVYLRLELEHLANHLLRGGGSDRAETELAGARAGRSSRSFRDFAGNDGFTASTSGEVTSSATGAKSFAASVARVRLHHRIDEEARRHHQQRVAIGRRVARIAWRASSPPGTILDHHRLATIRSELVAESPREQVAVPGRKGEPPGAPAWRDMPGATRPAKGTTGPVQARSSWRFEAGRSKRCARDGLRSPSRRRWCRS